MRNIVLVNQCSGYLMVDIANAYQKQCQNVVLISGSVCCFERKIDERIRVRKIVRYNRTTSLSRVLTWIFGTIQIGFILLFKYRKYEVVFVTNPPMAYLCSLLLKNVFSLIVYDAYPDALINAGINEDNWLYRKWERWNRNVFAKAKRIITLSNGMADCLSKYVDKDKVEVIPNWPLKDDFSHVDKSDNPFVREHHLEGKFVVMYSGNMGYTHNVDIIVELASRLKDNQNIHFLFIGDGKKKLELIARVKQLSLNNCSFLDWQPVEQLQYSLSSADLAVVTINEESAMVSVPSKTYNLMSVGAPLLCIAPDNSELKRLVFLYHNGECFNVDSIDDMAAYIETLAKDKAKCKFYSDNSLLASKSFTYANANLYV